MPLMISALVATSVFSAALAALARRKAAERLGERLAPISLLPRSTLFSLLARIGESALARGFGRKQELTRRLQRAGRHDSPDLVAGLKLGLGASAFLACLLTAVAEALALVLSPILALVCFRLPDFVLARLASRRQERIGANVPEFVELLIATTEAGLGPQGAFRRSAELVGEPLATELRWALHQIDLGVPWRRVLEQVLERTDVRSLKRVLGTLARSQRLGTSLRSTLRTVERDLRSERRARAEDFARRAPVKMLFPLVFLILPAFLLLTVGPVLLATLRSLR